MYLELLKDTGHTLTLKKWLMASATSTCMCKFLPDDILAQDEWLCILCSELLKEIAHCVILFNFFVIILSSNV